MPPILRAASFTAAALFGLAMPALAQDAMAPAAMAPMMSEDDLKLCLEQAAAITFPEVAQVAADACHGVHNGAVGADAMGGDAMGGDAMGTDAMAPKP